ncbi:hypothetical protein [Comamonas sp.]|uniref:hypothetical protein n=1 Tax=Comamonas sp. TaxID=34028 RepID=UPI00289E2B45|nr:hypothetical protein [Comamonas sp.]
MSAVLIKTPEGQQVFKERSALLAGKLRSAFLLFDGQRTVAEVLAATKGLGVVPADIEALQQAGFLQDLVVNTPELAPAGIAQRSPQDRYREAYPLAVALTGNLGLSGFRLNLSVEGSTCYDDLAAVAPKIKEAVGQSAYAPLERALFA